MVSEVYRSLEEQLGKLPEGSDRKFLEGIKIRFDKRARKPRLKEQYPAVAEAWRRIEEIVQRDKLNLYGYGVLSKRQRERNLKRQQESPDDSVLRLLPPEYRFFGATTNVLLRGEIRTKHQLARIPDAGVISHKLRAVTSHRRLILGETRLPGMGYKMSTVVLAMRDLARAEIDARKKTPQGPTPSI